MSADAKTTKNGIATGSVKIIFLTLKLPFIIIIALFKAIAVVFRHLGHWFNPSYNAVLAGDKVPRAYLHNTPTGFYIGKKYGKFVCIKAEDIVSHILVVGGSRSGKSAGIIIPNLLYSWTHSFVAIDIKGELYEKTKHIHHDALILDPYNDEDSVGFDPYEFLRLNEEEFLINARQLALALIPMPANIKDQFWINSSRNILTAAIIHFFQENFTFIQTMDVVLETDVVLLRDLLSESPYPEVKKYINQLRGVSDKTLSSVYGELSDRCMLFGIDKKIMRIMTKKPTLDMRVYSDPVKPPPKLFVRIPHNKIEYYSPFVNLFFTFLTIALDMRPDGQGAWLTIYFDEFAQFGHLHKLVGTIDTIASKNVMLSLYLQALSQAYKYYGEHDTKTIINNCDTRIILKIIDPDTQEYFSKMIGTVEIKRKSQSVNFEAETLQEKGRGENNYIQEIRIVKPESMAYLAEKREIIFLSGKGYCKVRHVRYYQKNEFRKWNLN